MPLALVRSEASNDCDAEKPEGLPAEYQTLKELHPQDWEATLAKMPRKLAATIRQLEQPGQANDSPVEILYYHTDHLGTPRELTDSEGHITWAATYKAWGNTAKIEHPPRLVTSADGNTLTQHWEQQEDPIEQNLRFQGQYFDAETGLHYNRFRYYDPDCGRFISQDPIGLLGGVNNYQYAPNPVAWIDPLGLTGGPIQEHDVTTYADFRRRSVIGDNLEGHEVLQHGVLKNNGVATARNGSDASKNNPVIALTCECHKRVNRAQREFDLKNQTPLENIEANSKILLDEGIDRSIVDDIRSRAIEHAGTIAWPKK